MSPGRPGCNPDAMTEIQFKSFVQANMLDAPAGLPAVFLIYGEDLLVEQACDRILESLLGDLDRQIHCEVIDGAPEETARVIEKLNTYGLLASLKIVVVKDSHVFYRRQSGKQLAAAVEEKFSQGKKLAAARCFAELCDQAGVDPADLPAGGSIPSFLTGISRPVLEELAQICRRKGLQGGSGEKWSGMLEKAISRGFPDRHYLILTTDTVDKRRSLYKTIASKGLVVDCSVARGNRAADRKAQEAVLRDNMREILAGAGKKAAPGVFQELWQRCGFELRQFTRDLEKVIDYVGPAKVIQPGDVARVVKRSKADPIFEFTNSLARRDASRAIFYLRSLLAADTHPLQLLAAMVNQVRKLLVARCFLDRLAPGTWQPSMTYRRFQQAVLPAVLEYDKAICDQAGGRKKTGDLLLASNPRSTYPVYQTLVSASGFNRTELIDAFRLLNRADVQLKSSSRRPALVLENVLMKICSKQGRRT